MYPAAATNEPALHGQGNAFLQRWFKGSDVGLTSDACMHIEATSLHAGPLGIAAGTEILWHYGDASARSYAVGKPCPRMKKSECESPCEYLNTVGQVAPADSYIVG